MKPNDLSRRAADATVAIVFGFGVAFGVAFSCRADSSPVDQGAAVPEVSCLNEGPVETYQAGKTDPAPVGKRIDRRALLVGVTKYDNLDRQYHLQGPANDVQLMRRLLQERYKFPPDGIVFLVRRRGRPRAEAADPSEHRAGVPRLAEQVQRRGSGRGLAVGSWGPPAGIRFRRTRNTPSPMESMRFSSPPTWAYGRGFLSACRTRSWTTSIGTWLRAIAARRAYIWVIFDCCHSATMTRGN